MSAVGKLNEGEISSAMLRIKYEWIDKQDENNQIEKTSLDASLYSIYAQCLRSLGHVEEALKYFDLSKSLFLEPHLNDEFVHDLAFDAGKYYMDEKNYEKAIEYFELGIKEAKKKDDEKCLYGLAIANENLNRTEIAEKLFLQLLEVSPNNSNYYNDIGIFYQTRKKDLELAEYYFLKGMKIDEENLLIQCHYGILLLEKHEIQKAKEVFEKVLKILPNNSDVLKFLGIISLKENNLNVAKDKMTIANKFKPNDPSILGYLGLIEHRLGNLKQSRNIYGHALSLINEENFDQDLLNNYITLLIDLEEFNEVDEAFNTYLDKFPDNQAFLGNYAIFLSNFRPEEHEKAEKYFLEATGNKEYLYENPECYINNTIEFTKFYKNRNEIHKGKKLFEKLIELIGQPHKMIYKEFAEYLSDIPEFKKLSKKYFDLEKNLEK